MSRSSLMVDSVRLISLQQAFENGLCERSHELEAGELLCPPDDAAILGLETRDAQPEPGFCRGDIGCLDAASMSGNVDDTNADSAAARFAHGGAEPQCCSLRTPAVGLADRLCNGMTYIAPDTSHDAGE